MRALNISLAAALICMAQAGMAAAPEQAKPPENSNNNKSINERDVSAVDVAATPANDLNLRKIAIPQLLLDAQDDPYSLAGMTRCSRIATSVTDLDKLLGDDFDLAEAKGTKLQAGRVAQSVVGSFIPFRGVIREISGANSQDRKMQVAILAGSERRAFLKGVGLQRGCNWPARPATAAVVARYQAQQDQAQQDHDRDGGKSATPTRPAPAPAKKSTRSRR